MHLSALVIGAAVSNFCLDKANVLPTTLPVLGRLIEAASTHSGSSSPSVAQQLLGVVEGVDARLAVVEVWWGGIHSVSPLARFGVVQPLSRSLWSGAQARVSLLTSVLRHSSPTRRCGGLHICTPARHNRGAGTAAVLGVEEQFAARVRQAAWCDTAPIALPSSKIAK